MDLRQATINDVPGKGYAHVRKDSRGRNDCVGVFYADSMAAGAKLMTQQGSNATYRGILYDGNEESVRSFSIIMTNVQTGTNQGLSVEFIASGNPYKER